MQSVLCDFQVVAKPEKNNICLCIDHLTLLLGYFPVEYSLFFGILTDQSLDKYYI